jgi:hypothetical protein
LKSTTTSPAGDEKDRREVMTRFEPFSIAWPVSVIPAGACTFTLLPSSL